MVATEFERPIWRGEQTYRHLFEHIPICIFVADAKVSPATMVKHELQGARS